MEGTLGRCIMPLIKSCGYSKFTPIKSIPSYENLKLTAFIFFSLFAIQIVSSESDKPNIIFMLADDMGYGDLGLNGNK